MIACFTRPVVVLAFFVVVFVFLVFVKIRQLKVSMTEDAATLEWVGGGGFLCRSYVWRYQLSRLFYFSLQIKKRER